MYDKQIVTAAMRRVSAARARLVQRHPFFGRLLLRLRYRFAPCGTACTDMENIIFDIDFLGKLSDAEVEFVLLHEVMHCVLQHCLRGKGKINLIYNIACDIVVNSFILEALGCPDFKIFGENAMHLAPEKTEGREHTAEEIYQMLLQNADIAKLATLLIDSHDGWQDIDAQRAKDEWGKYISDTARRMNGFDSVPLGMRRYLKEVSRTPTTNWRQLLQDYIRFDRSDYDFTSPDRRYDGDFLIPSFRENMFGDAVKGLWLMVDASGSIDDEALSEVMNEIYAAYSQLDNISGQLAFFDSKLYEFHPFETLDDLKEIQPKGGGGTSFHVIFKHLRSIDEEGRPALILIFTDGYAKYPDEEVALDIPVVWLIKGSGVEPPWGNCVYIE